MGQLSALSLGELDTEVKAIIYVLITVHVAALVRAATRRGRRLLHAHIGARLSRSCARHGSLALATQAFWFLSCCKPKRPHAHAD